jgi:hypothetical protein
VSSYYCVDATLTLGCCACMLLGRVAACVSVRLAAAAGCVDHTARFWECI